MDILLYTQSSAAQLNAKLQYSVKQQMSESVTLLHFHLHPGKEWLHVHSTWQRIQVIFTHNVHCFRMASGHSPLKLLKVTMLLLNE